MPFPFFFDEGAAGSGSNHALTANNIAAGNPFVGSPALAQDHALVATDVAAATPTVGTPALTQEHALSAISIAALAPFVGTPALVQNHAVLANNTAAGTPFVGNPVMVVEAGGIVIGGPPFLNPRNNYTGWVGYKFTPVVNLTIVSLGRFIHSTWATNHEVAIFVSPWGSGNKVASVIVTPTSTIHSLWRRENLVSPVVLAAGTEYRIASAEVNAGDNWQETSLLANDATKIGTIQSVFGAAGPSSTTGTAGNAFVHQNAWLSTGNRRRRIILTGS